MNDKIFKWMTTVSGNKPIDWIKFLIIGNLMK